MEPFTHPTLGPLRLGRPEPSPRTHRSLVKRMMLGAFLDKIIPDPPEVLDLTAGLMDWGMMKNDVEGDCTCASCGHQLQSYTGAAGRDKIVTVSDDIIEAEYEAISGFRPGDPSTDNGAYITDALDYFKNTGLAGHKIQAHAPIVLTELRVRQAMDIFGSLNFGVALPIACQDYIDGVFDLPADVDVKPFDPNSPWFPGSWGGHSMASIFYAQDKFLEFVSWGRKWRWTWRAVMFYAQEAHACIFPAYAKSSEPVADLVYDLEFVGS